MLGVKKRGKSFPNKSINLFWILTGKELNSSFKVKVVIITIQSIIKLKIKTLYINLVNNTTYVFI